MKGKIGWVMMAFLVLCLLVGLAVPLGIVMGGWQYTSYFVLAVLGLGGFIALAQWLIDSKDKHHEG